MPPDNQIHSVLEFVHGLSLSASPKTLRLENVLADLARAFGAKGAGLADLLEGHPMVQHRIRVDGPSPSSPRWPWLDQPQLLAQVRSTPTAVPVPASAGTAWLLAGIHRPGGAARLLWLEGPAEHAWSAAEAAALALAGHVLAQTVLADAETAPDQVLLHQRLRDAAVMSGRMAHAFDNVLTGILGFAELTLSQVPADSKPYRYITEVLEAAQQGVQFTQQLHRLGRCSTARPGKAALALAAAAEEARLRPALDRTVTLNIAVPADLPAVAIDLEPLQQVLGPLLDNAREALAAGGTISLSGGRTELASADCRNLFGNPAPGPHLEVTVTDTGPGLSAETRRRLFVEPFFSTKPRHRGLGLAVVYLIVYAHKGGLRIDAGPQGGTSVHVFLPLAPDATP